MATPATEKLVVALSAAFGSTQGAEQLLLNFTEAASVVGFQKVIIPVELPTSVTDQSLNLSTFVDTATWIIVRSRNNVGFHMQVVTGQAAGNRMQVPGNGLVCFKNANTTPPTLFFSNITGAADKEFLEVIVLGTSS